MITFDGGVVVSCRTLVEVTLVLHSAPTHTLERGCRRRVKDRFESAAFRRAGRSWAFPIPVPPRAPHSVFLILPTE